MTVGRITTKNQFDELIASDRTVFIDFYADWCGPCKAISPEFQKLAQGYVKEGVEFYQLNIDDLQDVAQEAGISSIPAFHVYRQGGRVDQVVGANRAALTTLVQKHGTA